MVAHKSHQRPVGQQCELFGDDTIPFK